MTLLDTYDPDPTAVLDATKFIAPVPGFPERVVVTYSRHKFDAMLEGRDSSVIFVINTSAVSLPIHRLEVDGVTLALMLCTVGAPAAAGTMEELIALGGKTFLFFGSCGVLDAEILEGHIAVPTHAYRDEGVSYHYLPAADYIEIRTASILAGLLDDLDVPYHLTRTWTTDAVYRETRRNMERRKAEGCRVVEMECAATAAVAQARGVAFYQFVYGADSLDGDEWDARTLAEETVDDHHVIASLALTLAARLP